MPNPPFTPLTLSVEEWKRLTTGVRGSAPWPHEHWAVIAECEAQAQEAASLRQRLEVIERDHNDTLNALGADEHDLGPGIAKEVRRERDQLRQREAKRTNELSRLGAAFDKQVALTLDLQAQLAQAQQERDQFKVKLDKLVALVGGKGQTEETFWEFVTRTSREVEKWPEWKRGK